MVTVSRNVKSPESFDGRWQVPGGLNGYVHFQELIEVPVLTVLHDHAQWLFDGAHSQHSGYVRVVQTGQNSDVVLQFSPEKKAHRLAQDPPYP